MSTEWLIFAVAAGAGGSWYSLRRRDAGRWERAAAVALPVLLVALVYVYRETALLNTRWPWSACRLAAVFGWVHGYPLYSPIDHGPINGWLYGPVAAIAWLPATLAASPQSALMVAALINLGFLLIPLHCVARQSMPQSRLGAGLLFVAGAAALPQLYPTWYMASALNVDAIAVGLGTGSCLLLLRRDTGNSRLVLAALLGVLAVWTKQVEAPLVVAQCGWLWFCRDRRAALTFVLAYGGFMAAIAGAVFSLLSVRDVIFNLWTVPSHHAFIGGWRAAWGELADLSKYGLPLWAPCLVALVIAARGKKNECNEPAPAEGTALLFLAALVLLPTGIMATIKMGGDRNSLHSVYYLLAAALGALGGRWLPEFPRRNEWLAGALLTI
ncbi:MAG TPA: hypothetical protein VFJ90_08420, partial [Candidatus Didemnitutus sp.]|nr:hypothetical protein [Candidatus Didemnitutus sp.]